MREVQKHLSRLLGTEGRPSFRVENVHRTAQRQSTRVFEDNQRIGVPVD